MDPNNVMKITDPFGGVYMIYLVTICKVILFVEGTISLRLRGQNVLRTTFYVYLLRCEMTWKRKVATLQTNMSLWLKLCL